MTDLNERISAYLKNLSPKQSGAAWARLLRECQAGMNPWVSVEDRLPDNPQWCLGVWPYPWDSTHPPYFVFQYYGQELKDLERWMPLPEPPE